MNPKLLTTSITIFSLLSAVRLPSSEILEERIYQSANRERTVRHYEPLAYDDRMETAARIHCGNMVRYNFIDHVDQLGRDAGVRMSEYYPELLGGFGENIAAFPLEDPDTLDRRIVAAWLDSTAHSANLLSKDYTFTGVGVLVTNGSVYAVQTFGRIVAKVESISPSAPRAGQTVKLTFRKIDACPRYAIKVYVKFPDARAEYRSPDGKIYVGGGYFEPSWFAGSFSVAVPLNFGRGVYTIYMVVNGTLYPNGYRIDVR